MQTLNIIEPTLFDQTGHSFGYVKSLIKANCNLRFNIKVWLDKRGKDLLGSVECNSQPYFYRPLRQLQKLILYWKLVKKSEIIFIGTTELWDLKILRFYLKHFKTNAKIVLHFHQFKQNPDKLKYLQKHADQCKQMHILVPTQKLAAIFHNNGFKQCIVMPCPTFAEPRSISENATVFNKVLYAGAARNDKGFPTVIGLLQHLRQQQNFIPFEIQVSTPNSQRYDSNTEAAINILHSISDKNLTLHKTTLDQQQYLDLFNNSICLLLYNQKDYEDKFSGIALDAFYAGCPVITIQNTWMGETTEKYAAGIALTDYNNINIQIAIETIIANYAFYQANAKLAAIELAKVHDPINTLQFISQKCI